MGATLTISHIVAESDLRALLNSGLIHTTESDANESKYIASSRNREAGNGNYFLKSPDLVLGCLLSLRPKGSITFFFFFFFNSPSLAACLE